jgi:hypothetical protein
VDAAALQGPGDRAHQRSADELEAARHALEEARRQIQRSPLVRPGPAEPFDPTRIAYEMELAEHRSTIERLHRAELAARDATISHQRVRIAELEYEVRRLVTALQVLAGLPVPEAGGTSTTEDGGHDLEHQ